MIKTVTQNHGLGCGVACVAAVLGISYERALGLFVNPERAWTEGFYCRDLVRALELGGKVYRYKKIQSSRDPILKREGTIVFTRFSIAYPRGHYLVRIVKGWMNPWVNYPEIAPAKSGRVARLPAPVDYAIFEVEL